MSEELSPETALAAGFLDQIVPADQQQARAMEVAKQAAALPAMYGFNKKSLRAAALTAMREALPQPKG